MDEEIKKYQDRMCDAVIALIELERDNGRTLSIHGLTRNPIPVRMLAESLIKQTGRKELQSKLKKALQE